MLGPVEVEGGENACDVDVLGANGDACGLDLRKGISWLDLASCSLVCRTNNWSSSLTSGSSSTSSSSASSGSITRPSRMACATLTPLITATSVLWYRFPSTIPKEKTCLFGVEDSGECKNKTRLFKGEVVGCLTHCQVSFPTDS